MRSSATSHSQLPMRAIDLRLGELFAAALERREARGVVRQGLLVAGELSVCDRVGLRLGHQEKGCSRRSSSCSGT